MNETNQNAAPAAPANTTVVVAPAAKKGPWAMIIGVVLTLAFLFILFYVASRGWKSGEKAAA